MESAQKQLGDAREARDRAEKRWMQIREQEPDYALAGAVSALQKNRDVLQRQADQEALDQPQSSRSKAIEQRIAAIDQDIARQQRMLEERTAHREQAEVQRRTALAELDIAEGRMREVKGDVLYRGDRLRVIDPGIVPERPSSPVLLLNAVGAWFLATLLTLGYLAFRFGSTPRLADLERAEIELGIR